MTSDHSKACLTFCSPVDQRFDEIAVFLSDLDQSGIDPSSSRNGIQASDDDIELLVEGLRVILDLAMISVVTHVSMRFGSAEAMTYGVTLTPGTRFMMNSAATVAFDLPTSASLHSVVNLAVQIDE